jgi:hypothetical protein
LGSGLYSDAQNSLKTSSRTLAEHPLCATHLVRAAEL